MTQGQGAHWVRPCLKRPCIPCLNDHMPCQNQFQLVWSSVERVFSLNIHVHISFSGLASIRPVGITNRIDPLVLPALEDRAGRSSSQPQFPMALPLNPFCTRPKLNIAPDIAPDIALRYPHVISLCAILLKSRRLTCNISECYRNANRNVMSYYKRTTHTILHNNIGLHYRCKVS